LSITVQNASRIERAEIGDDRHCHALDALVMESARKMVMIDDVVPKLRAENHGNHVPAEKLAALLAHLPPAFALRLNFAHADGNLGRAQFANGDGRQYGVANRHGRLLNNASRRGERRGRAVSKTIRRSAGNVLERCID
jgi:hypothetical protein